VKRNAEKNYKKEGKKNVPLPHQKFHLPTGLHLKDLHPEVRHLFTLRDAAQHGHYAADQDAAG
jgi:hypothetical protein